MSRNITCFLFALSVVFATSFSASAQFVNFEDTWAEFLAKEKTSNTSELVKPAKEDTGNYAKYSLIYANSHFCAGEITDAEKFIEEIEWIGETNYSSISGYPERFDKLVRNVDAYHKVDAFWSRFIKNKDVSLEELKTLEDELKLCEKGTLAKYNYMLAYQSYCDGNIQDASNYFLNRVVKLVKNTSLKTSDVEGLTEEYQLMDTHFAGLKKLGAAWKTYKESGNSPGFDEEDLPEIPCYPIPSIKAYILIAAADLCNRGAEMLAKIDNLLEGSIHRPDEFLNSKIVWLRGEVGKYDGDVGVLREAWQAFLPNDTLLSPVQLADYYCEKLDQIRSWTIKGHLDACASGQGYLDQIDDFQKTHSLEFGEEIDCKVHRLRIKVWDCRYWELVRQAQRETHEERERFGPMSADTMQADLNSDKQPCPTTVVYDSLGYIGIKYTITTFLCQDIDLAKMGDPEYYKKIAAWVDNEVLKEYCEPNLRCKEEFFIYLEGHTDGHVFRGASYRNSLDIPEGTAFTHFLGDEIIEKTTEREITKSLKNNTELGLARAWTVKQQLDFMAVPIRIGAFEHPESEKGGEYRRIEIELNITNLLLDFYEKRLAELLEASGIGDRPENC